MNNNLLHRDRAPVFPVYLLLIYKVVISRKSIVSCPNVYGDKSIFEFLPLFQLTGLIHFIIHLLTAYNIYNGKCPKM